ncbi:uncharacterized protein LOC108858346 [Raphanus sativus]|uniref:Uncharacterized protein LOC108858346 n=1 Tax=Raphanus sativus TaxID=3726 RepID=A0A6J0NVL5_RAPSA|nr:uncharacterized protein LOC108858346 [Raphanus sativus]
MDHLERFEDLISAIKENGVSTLYLLCKLFKYSLVGEALQWLKQLPPGSITSWANIKNAFLRNFFDETGAEDLRSKIATLAHEPTEFFRNCWVRFRSYQRECPHHEFNQVQLLSTFFRGLDLAYKTTLDTASEGNFNTRNPEEVVRLIENLASSNSTKNTDYERRKSATTLGKEHMDDVSFAEDVEAVETDEERYVEEDVNYISGTGFQRSGNQSGNMNLYGNSQRSNYRQNSQYQKPYNNNNKSLNNYFYQNPAPPTQERKIEAMLDQVLEGQQRLTVKFNEKINYAYTNLNAKFNTFSAHVRKLETQVIQI